jgi:hypothetical protein
MKALTLIQPWATAIACWGKDVENRSWAPPTSLLGQRFAIHAGKGRELDAFALFVRARGIESRGMVFDQLPSGAVVATVRLAATVKVFDEGPLRGVRIMGEANRDRDRTSNQAAMSSPWLVGQWGWVLDEVRLLAEPVPCPGFQRLWNLPSDVEALVLEQEHHQQAKEA